MSWLYEDDIEDFLDDLYEDEDYVEDDDYDDWDDYDICHECQGYGDDYYMNECGELECACWNCPCFTLNQDDWDD